MAKTCSTMSKPLRGGIGFLVGGTVGALAGGIISGVMVASAMAKQPDQGPPPLWFPFLIPGGGLLGSATGILIGIRKPEC